MKTLSAMAVAATAVSPVGRMVAVTVAVAVLLVK